MSTTLAATAARARSVIAPVSLIVSAFAPVRDVRRTLTPVLQLDRGASALLLIDLSRGRNRLGMSALAQVFNAIGGDRADVDEPQLLAGLAAASIELRARDAGARLSRPLRRRTAGDAGRDGICRPLRPRGRRWQRGRARRCAQLFAEEPGVVLQVQAVAAACRARLPRSAHGLAGCVQHDRRADGGDAAAHPRHARRCSMRPGAICDAPGRRPPIACASCATIPQCAEEEFAALLDLRRSGPVAATELRSAAGHRGAADRARRAAAGRGAARAGRQRSGRDGGGARSGRASRPHDVHMSDLLDGERTLRGASPAWSPAAGSPTAMCSARAAAGRARSCFTSARGASSSASSRAATPSRSACATAVRCSRCSRS